MIMTKAALAAALTWLSPGKPSRTAMRPAASQVQEGL